MNWWIFSDAGLLVRVAVGVSIFAALAILDLRRNRTRATRWREYSFLLACVAAALLYGIVNDQITTTISWEYFAYGKGVAEALPDAPPNSPAFRWEAAKIGMKATWSAGLLIGVALLIANNPRRDRPQLSYRRLVCRLLVIFAIAAITAAALGLAGYFGLLARFSEDFRIMLEQDQWRPRRFMAVFGIHLGGYLGGLVGTAAAIARILRARRKTL